MATIEAPAKKTLADHVTAGIVKIAAGMAEVHGGTVEAMMPLATELTLNSLRESFPAMYERYCEQILAEFEGVKHDA